ncbi:MAG: PUA domain-containing protein, partial [Tepidiphilus sp.]
GGMITKIRAAARAAKSGAHTVIASGREPEVIVRLAHGEPLGTLLYAERNRLAARKQWLADHLKLAGRLYVDAGAARALRQGKSLLPVGVTRVEGEFVRGAAVACLDPEGREIGRGLINYSAAEARAILGLPSNQIAERLGHVDEPELIHRDNFVRTG